MKSFWITFAIALFSCTPHVLAAQAASVEATAALGWVQVSRAGAPVGRVSDGWKCPATLIAADVALVQAHCFDHLDDQPAGAFALAFVLPAGLRSPAFAAGVVRLRRMPDYKNVSCGQAEYAEVCRQAKNYCLHHYAGRGDVERRWDCLGDLSFVARGFLSAPADDLALLFLDDRAAIGGMALASPPADWPTTTPVLEVLLDAATSRSGPRQLSRRRLAVHNAWPTDLDVDSVADPSSLWGVDEAVQFAYLQVAAQGRPARPALVALPSHPALFALSTERSARYRYARVDAAIEWIRQEMAAGCNHGRIGCDAAEVLVPDVDPSPAPEPPPAPLPPPAPGPPPRHRPADRAPAAARTARWPRRRWPHR